MTDKNDNNPILIFYRPKTNAEECLANQQAFIKSYTKHLAVATIDFVADDRCKVQEIFDLIKKKSRRKIMIVQSSLSKEKFSKEYDLQIFFDFYKKMQMLDIYLMDSEGKIYEEVKNINEI